MVPKTWNYERVNENGYLQSYYGIGQTWTYTDGKADHEMVVKGFTAKPNGVQYYWVSIDGKFQGKSISAARLHYLLNEKNAVEIEHGVLQSFPLQIADVERYFKHLAEIGDPHDCDVCAGTGIDDYGKN